MSSHVLAALGQEYHLCHCGGGYKDVNLDSSVRKLSNSVQMSVRVTLLFKDL